MSHTYRKVLIVTHRAAQEVDGVIDHLREKGIEVIRWNLCQYPEYELCSVDEETVDLSLVVIPFSENICAGWVHDVGNFSIESALEGVQREIALNECNAFLEGVLFSLSCRWLNDPKQIKIASSKLYQLRLASMLGFQVPDYVVTNSYDRIENFVSRHQSTILKGLSKSYIVYGAQRIKIFTKRFSDFQNKIRDALRYGSVIVQRELSRMKEVRVTVVDGRCFSVDIDLRNLPSNVVDYRELDFFKERSRFRRAENVEEVEERSRMIVNSLGLSYAGVDWAVTNDGSAYFLECNPLGSFKWYEMTSGYDITRFIANALMERAFWTANDDRKICQ